MTDFEEKTPIFLHPKKRLELFEKGQALFNEEQFFEAHEAWEELWRMEQEREKTFLQGLIQTAGHFVHQNKGNVSGAFRLADAAKQKLTHFDPTRLNPIYRSLDLAPVLSALEYNMKELSLILAEQKPTTFISNGQSPQPHAMPSTLLIPKLLTF